MTDRDPSILLSLLLAVVAWCVGVVLLGGVIWLAVHAILAVA